MTPLPRSWETITMTSARRHESNDKKLTTGDDSTNRNGEPVTFSKQAFPVLRRPHQPQRMFDNVRLPFISWVTDLAAT